MSLESDSVYGDTCTDGRFVYEIRVRQHDSLRRFLFVGSHDPA